MCALVARGDRVAAIGAEAVAAQIEALRNQGLEVDLEIGHPSWRSQARVVIVGEEGVSCGAPPPGGVSWKRALLQELSGQLDLSRIHFVGRVPHPLLHELFRICACNVYLTYPFVLSWSLLEAMACAAVVIGSATAPVQEVIESERNGFLADFFDLEAMAHTIAAVLADTPRFRPLGQAARQTVMERYDLATICLPAQLALVEELAAGRRPMGGAL